jgi:eukaryotic-like serine/threonine-protein kinase
VKTIFAAALERPAEARSAFVREACDADPRLGEDVLALLAAQEDARDFLQRPLVGRVEPPVTAADPDSTGLLLEGDRVGPYRIVSCIGHGGMGSVYLALRDDDQYRRRVAMKIVRHGLISPELVHRFRQERQILASLDHEGIAKLLDGGATDDGRPYLVMEYVEGQSIDQFCDNRRLSVVERLELFRTVCAAVQFAHQNLIVHRDLKPGNVLVSATGVAKLLDFGIAKLLNPELATSTLLPTRQDVRLMTPEYASPEQARGEPVTTASDVYSLGVLLYELLTGHLPYRVAGRPLHDVARIICDTDPPKPSTVIGQVVERAGASGETRRLTPEDVSRTREGRVDRLRRRLSGDLDVIVLKALKKEPQRRYLSVEQFSEDIRRHLAGLPITARPDTLGYRTGKFLRRHRGGVAAAALLIVSMLAGLGATLWQAQRAERERGLAERRFNEVRGLANSLLFELHDSIARLPGSTATRQLLVERALGYLDRLAADRTGDAAFQRELAAAYRRVGDVQGNPYQANLGDPAAAARSYRQALAILERLDAVGEEREQRWALARTFEGLGDVQAITGEVAGGLASQQRALALRRLLAESGAEADRRDLAASHAKVGQAAYWAGKSADALSHQREGLRLREQLAAARPGDPDVQLALGSSLNHVGEMLLVASEAAASLEHYRRAEALLLTWTARRPDDARIARQLAISHTKVGEGLASQGDLAGGVARHQMALRVRRALADADPQDVQARRDVAISHVMLAEPLGRTGDRAGRLAALDAGLAIFEQLAAGSQKNLLALADLASARVLAGRMLLGAGDAAQAAPHFERARDIGEGVVRADPSDLDTRRQLVSAHEGLGDVHSALARASGETGDRPARWRRARTEYLTARQMLSGMAATPGPEDTVRVTALSERISACDAALAGAPSVATPPP